MSDKKRQAVRSVAVTLAAQAIKFFIGLSVTMVLARLLTPKDYGAVAMVGAFTGFLAVFKDGGLSIATVQRADITEAQISTLFWINVALGVGTALVISLLSPVVGWFYNDNSLILIVLALAVPFVLGGMTAQLQALMQRQMQFKEIAIIDIVSLVISAGVGIFSAYSGWGSWSLVAMTITLTTVNTLLVYYFCRWRPSRPVRGAGVRSLLKFGGEITANKLFDSIACSTDSLLLGKFFTSDMVGLYTRAQTLMLLPLSQLMPPLLSVSLPVMSRLAERPESLKRVFLDLLQLTAFASSFIAVMLFVGADWLISVFLGPNWIETGDILRLLSGPALFIPLSTLCVAILTAQGQGSALVRWSALKNVATIVAMFAGISWGAKGIAAALSITSIFILMPILNSITAKCGPANLKEIWGATGLGALSCAAGCGILFYIRNLLDIENPIIALSVLFLINSIFHGLIMSVFPSCRHSFTRVLNVIKSSRAV